MCVRVCVYVCVCVACLAHPPHHHVMPPPGCPLQVYKHGGLYLDADVIMMRPIRWGGEGRGGAGTEGRLPPGCDHYAAPGGLAPRHVPCIKADE